MSGTVILYRSKYGATKKYAELLAEKLHCKMIENKKLDPKQVQPFDKIILCGGIYASGISGISFLKKNQEILKEKQVAVFAVGASPYDEQAIAALRAHNLGGQLGNIPLFYGRGAWNEEKMTRKDKILCGMLKKMVAKKTPETCEPWEAALLSAIGQTCEWVDEKYLIPVTDYIQGKEQVL